MALTVFSSMPRIDAACLTLKNSIGTGVRSVHNLLTVCLLGRINGFGIVRLVSVTDSQIQLFAWIIWCLVVNNSDQQQPYVQEFLLCE
jgi:hypothetical protein